MIARDEVWLRAWCANASAFGGTIEGSARYADACLKAFDERFPPRKPNEATYCGTPLSELTDEERAEAQEYLFGRMTAGGR